jgi:hypothetical protein
MEHFAPEQMKEIMSRTQVALERSRSLTPVIASLNIKCMSCEVGLNMGAGAIIAALIGAGIVVGPELAGVVAIAEATGLEAATVATIINGAIAGGGGTTVESIIYELCHAMGAC